MRAPRALLAATVVATLALGGCTSTEPDAAPSPSTAPSTSSDPERIEDPADSSTPTADPSASSSLPTALPSPPKEPIRQEPPDPVSLPAYFPENHDYQGRGLRLGEVRERTDAYTSYDATYRSDGLTISGVLNVPQGRGPFPAVVLAHGYIDPDVYVRGQGMTRERGVLASRGYVALHVDYRAHAESDGTEEAAERNLRLGYVADVLNAVTALKRTRAVPVIDSQVSLFGRSMGGGVVYRALAAAPGRVAAAAVWAPVSSREDDSFDRWTLPDRPDVAQHVAREHGLPGTPRGRDFWREVSARTYFTRVTEPVLIVQGGSDDTCPPGWARESYRALRHNGVEVELAWYPDEEHAFGPRFLDAMDRTIAFLGANQA